jgi:hypothetical protein
VAVGLHLLFLVHLVFLVLPMYNGRQPTCSFTCAIRCSSCCWQEANPDVPDL